MAERPRNRRGATEEVACEQCGLCALCRVAGPTEVRAEDEGQVIISRRPVARGELLVREGESFHSVFAVKSGAVKVLSSEESDGERVVDFQIPGELFGFEGINEGRYPYAIRAMEPSQVCEIRCDKIDRLGERVPAFQREMMRVMGECIQQYQQAALLIGIQNGEQRLAAFLVHLSRRFDRRGLSGSEFRLPIPRREIAGYLGLAVETVSRLLRRFQEVGLLEGSGRKLVLNDLSGLAVTAGEQSKTPFPLEQRG